METGATLVDIPTPKLDTQFYDKSTESISLLKAEQVSKIKRFYFLVNAYQHAIEKTVLSKSDKYALKAWLTKALGTAKYAKKFGTELMSEF